MSESYKEMSRQCIEISRSYIEMSHSYTEMSHSYIEIVNMIRIYRNHTLQTDPRHYEEEPQNTNSHKPP